LRHQLLFIPKNPLCRNLDRREQIHHPATNELMLRLVADSKCTTPADDQKNGYPEWVRQRPGIDGHVYRG